MDRIPLNAQNREILGRKVKKLREDGFIPGHIYGKEVSGENISVERKPFKEVFNRAGETGLIDLRVGTDKIRPVLIRGLDFHPLSGALLHVDFYQVNLSEKVQVPVPVELIGEQPESVHLGETVVLQPLLEIQIEALPTDLIEKVVVDQSVLKQVDDSVLVSDLKIDRSKITILTPEEEVVIKLAPAITEEMKKLMEEQAAEAAAAAAQAAEAGIQEVAEGAEGETPPEKEVGEDGPPDGGVETETKEVGESSEQTTENQPTK